MSSKKIIKNEISIEYEGATHLGIQEIIGTTKKYQTIHYRNLSKRQSMAFTKKRENQMHHLALTILRELVIEYYSD